MSGVFFPWRYAADHILVQELLTVAGDGVHVQTQKIPRFGLSVSAANRS